MHFLSGRIDSLGRYRFRIWLYRFSLGAYSFLGFYRFWDWAVQIFFGAVYIFARPACGRIVSLWTHRFFLGPL